MLFALPRPHNFQTYLNKDECAYQLPSLFLEFGVKKQKIPAPECLCIHSKFYIHTKFCSEFLKNIPKILNKKTLEIIVVLSRITTGIPWLNRKKLVLQVYN